MSGASKHTYFPEIGNKVLSITFFVAVTILNIVQFLTYSRRHKQIQTIKKPLHWMQMNQAMAGIALCASFIGEALLYFKEDPKLSCTMLFFVNKYADKIYPFFFGCSLVVQGVYLVLKFNQRKWRTSQTSSWWLGIALPIILTLLIIVPMGMTDTECSINVDWTLTKVRAVEVLSGVLPPALAFILSLLIFSQRPAESQETRTEEYEEYSLQMASRSPVSTAPSEQEVTTVFQTPRSYNANPYPSLYPQDQQNVPPPALQYPSEYWDQNGPSSYSPQANPVTSTQYSLDQYGRQRFQQNYPVIAPKNPTPANQSGPNEAAITSHEVRKFFSIHVVLTSVFMLSVIPLSAFRLHLLDLHSFTSEEDLKVHNTAWNVLFWIKHIYPTLIPLILTRTSR